MKKIFFKLFLVTVSFVLFTVTFGNQVTAATSPLQISPVHFNGNSPCNVFYTSPTYSFNYTGGTVWLSANDDGTGNIYTDDKIEIQITHDDSTVSNFVKDYGNGQQIQPTPPQDITTLFKSGNNQIRVTMTDLYGPYCNSSSYYIVETTNGGGSVPAKPNIEPRSVWKGSENDSVTQHTPNRIAVHHTATSNDPGNIATRYRELAQAIKLNALGVFNVVNVLNTQGDYSSIRNTWPGEIFLIRLDHKSRNYADIGYQYLVDPTGKIYEGRRKGNLGENADAIGQSIANANTGLISISLLGRYGSDGNAASDAINGGVKVPTQVSVESIQKMTNWLSGKYNIQKDGQYQLPQTVNGQPSCVLSSDQCNVPTIAGHKDYISKTQVGNTECPGDNLYPYLTLFRGQSSSFPTGLLSSHTNPTGLLIGGFSPIILGIVDPSGNRLGIDPSSGQYLNNITNGSYGNMLLSDTEEDDHSSPYFIHVPTTQTGVYKIDVVGTGTGSFTLATEDISTSNARAMAGSTVANQKDNYQIIYDNSNPGNLEMYHDTVPPVTTGTMSCSRDMNGVCRSSAVFKLTATDTGTNNDPASGVSKIECSYDNKSTWQQCGDVNGATVTITNNGPTSFWYRSIDRVLNIETAKHTGSVSVEQFLALSDTVNSTSATTLETKGILHSNGNMSFTNNTTAKLDILNYRGTYTQSGNVTFSFNSKALVSQTYTIPSYPLSYYKSRCTNFTGNIIVSHTGKTYNECIYSTGDITFRSTTPQGKITLVSEGFIYDRSTTATLQPWDTTNGILYYSAKGYSTSANWANNTGVIYAPTAQVTASFSNTTFNGSFIGKTVGFGSGTSLNATQAAGFPATTYNLPL